MTKRDPLLRTVKETAEILGFSETTIWVMIRNGDLVSIEPKSASGTGRRAMRRIEQAEIDDWIKRNRTPATT